MADADKDARWYTVTPGTLKSILEKIPALGTPARVNSEWLASIGHGGGNNRSVLRVFKNVGLVGSDGAPTDVWPAFRGGDRAAFAEGVRAGYAQLFAIYPDAHQKDAEALTSFFRSNTGLGVQGQRLCVQTFQTLVSFGDFAELGKAPTLPARPSETIEREERAERTVERAAGGFGLTVNIQLQLPPSADGEVYDKLFEAMAKHLRGLIKTQ